MFTVQIQARLGSTRLPGKVLYPLGSRRVLGWVLERCRRAKTPEGVVLTVGDRPENDAIREWCVRNGLEYETGPEEDLLKRHLKTAEAVDSDPVIRVTGDCPFVPSSEIDRVVREHEQNTATYTTNVTEEMVIGTAVDVIDKAVLEELSELGDDHPVRRLRENPEKWNTTFTPDDQWTTFSETHTAVDTPCDYWLLSDAIDAVGDDPIKVAEWVSKR